MQTPDLTDKNIEQIASLFPHVIKEIKDESGNIKKAVDFDSLKQILSKELVEEGDERYRLDWPGKKASLLKANTPIIKTLRPCREESVNFDTTENLYIEGDNFEVLKILQESYLGKVKMIYIDPPYNTGSDFLYKDDFKVSKEEYEEDLGVENEEGEKLFKNTDSNGRFHSDWLSMMYERLVVARDLLKDDGVIFISIDDNEVHNLRKICDEIFGEDNFVCQLSVVRSKNGLGSKEGYATNNDFMLVYKKSMLNKNAFLGLKIDEEYILKFNKEDEYGKFKMDGIFRKKGDGQRRVDSPGCYYPLYYNEKGEVFLEKTTNLKTAVPKLPDKTDGRWIWSTNFAKERLHRLYVSKGGTVYVKDYLKDAKRMKPKTILDKNSYITEIATEEIKSIFTGKIFDTPKPTKLIIDILDNATENDSVILDFFSGSATTAHAVMQLNAEDGGKRKFIMVQLPEKTDEKSEAYKAGYKTISDIGKERIRRAGKKIKEESGITAPKLDIGFRVYKTDDSNMKEVFYHPNDLQQEQLSAFESNIKEDRTPDDILTQVILDLGLELSLPIEKKEIHGNTVYTVQTNALVACFDNSIDFKLVDKIAEIQPFKVVFKDASFKYDKDRINLEERFKRLSPETKVTVI